MSDTKTTVTAQPTIKVIGAGLGRTGTMSMKKAMEILGFGPCHHMSVLPDKPAMVQGFVDAYHGKAVDWKTILAGYGSICDNPGCDFVPQLMTAFPDAKVVLTVRDTPEAWWKSVSETVLKSMMPMTRPLTLSLGPQLWKFMRVPREIRLRWLRKYGELGPGIYVKHNAEMMALVPPEKMLVFNVKEGWGPLCAFLGVPVPKVPFPKVNEGPQWNKMFRTMQIMAVGAWTVELSVLGLIVWQVVKHRAWEALGLKKLFGWWM